jgi:hypothetical protein
MIARPSGRASSLCSQTNGVNEMSSTDTDYIRAILSHITINEAGDVVDRFVNEKQLIERFNDHDADEMTGKALRALRHFIVDK